MEDNLMTTNLFSLTERAYALARDSGLGRDTAWAFRVLIAEAYEQGSHDASQQNASPAVQVRELERTIELLLAYGEARFGDEWWPGNARHWIPDGRELEYLLDPGSAELADQDSAASPRLAGRRRPWTDTEIPEGALDRALGTPDQEKRS